MVTAIHKATESLKWLMELGAALLTGLASGLFYTASESFQKRPEGPAADVPEDEGVEMGALASSATSTSTSTSTPTPIPTPVHSDMPIEDAKSATPASHFARTAFPVSPASSGAHLERMGTFSRQFTPDTAVTPHRTSAPSGVRQSLGKIGEGIQGLWESLPTLRGGSRG
jgi:hypothetical protein